MRRIDGGRADSAAVLQSISLGGLLDDDAQIGNYHVWSAIMLLPLGVGSVLGYFDPFHADPNGKRPSSYNGRQHQQHIQHP